MIDSVTKGAWSPGSLSTGQSSSCSRSNRRRRSRSSGSAMKNRIWRAKPLLFLGGRELAVPLRRIEEVRHFLLRQVEHVLQRLENAQFLAGRLAIRHHHRDSQPEGQLARGLVGEAIDDGRQDVLEAVRLGHALCRVLDGELEIVGVDAVELGPLEDLAVDLLHLDAVDASVGGGGEDHRLEERRLARRVSEVDTTLVAHSATVSLLRRSLSTIDEAAVRR